MSRITVALASLALAGLAALIPTAANASTSAGAVRANDSTSTAVRADGIRVTSAAPQSVTVLDSGNNNAGVVGVPYCATINVAADCWTWVNTTSGTPCPAGHFCIYTNVYAFEGGKVFSFYHCRYGGSDWALQAWNGTGLYNNSNTGGAHAYIKGSSHNTLLNTAPGDRGEYNFVPAYYVQAC